MNKKLARRILALTLSIMTLWAAVVTASSETLDAALSAMKESTALPRQLLRWELGDLFSDGPLSPVTMVTLRQSPLLLAQRTGIAALRAQTSNEETESDSKPSEPPVEAPPAPKPTPVSTDPLTDGLQFLDNGIPPQTVHPTSESGYTVVNGVYIKNTSSHELDAAALSAMDFSARPSAEGPQVLIIHSHGSEAYAMPPGEEYVPTGDYRTDDDRCNILRVGDEVASVLSSYGLSVLHDRTLHDVPSYNDSYSNSLAAMESYLAEYPSISFILDIHRDAIADADGNQYKVISEEEPHAAQVSLVMGNAYDGWQDNLKLAVAVQSHISESYPTLMRPIAVRGYRYNQHLTPGSMLVEIGTAGNSMDEALLAARIFAKGLAETILAK